MLSITDLNLITIDFGVYPTLVFRVAPRFSNMYLVRATGSKN